MSSFKSHFDSPPPLLCNPPQTVKMNPPIILVFLDMNIMLPGLWHLVSQALQQASQSFQKVFVSVNSLSIPGLKSLCLVIYFINPKCILKEKRLKVMKIN